jgi:hypothetical protein
MEAATKTAPLHDEVSLMRTMTKFGSLGLAVLITALLTGGCPTNEVNPFLTLFEQEILAFTPEPDTGDGSGGAGDGEGGGTSALEAAFRDPMTLTFQNNSARGDLEFNLLAWVNTTSIASDEDRDDLFNSNYMELTEEVRIGSVFVLPPGTFVYNGGGANGNLRFRIPRGTQSGATGGGEDVVVIPGNADTPVADSLTLASPDGMLIYLDPPVSCDSTAFVFLDDGRPVVSFMGDGFGSFGGAIRDAGLKPQSLINFTECDPLRPGLFLKTGGGVRAQNEFFEGEDITFDFFLEPAVANPDDNVNEAEALYVTFGGVAGSAGAQFFSPSTSDEDDDTDEDDNGDDEGDGGDNTLAP